MYRCALLVDAGRLYSAGGALCHGTDKRGELQLDTGATVRFLVERCIDWSKLPLHRTYWYDAAPDARPTAEHGAFSALSFVTLRLGRLVTETKKGDDRRALTR